MDLIDIYRNFHPKSKEYTFFSTLHGTSSKIYHIFGHKIELNIYKKIAIIPCLLSDPYGVRVIFKSNKNSRMTTYT